MIVVVVVNPDTSTFVGPVPHNRAIPNLVERKIRRRHFGETLAFDDSATVTIRVLRTRNIVFNDKAIQNKRISGKIYRAAIVGLVVFQLKSAQHNGTVFKSITATKSGCSAAISSRMIVGNARLLIARNRCDQAFRANSTSMGG